MRMIYFLHSCGIEPNLMFNFALLHLKPCPVDLPFALQSGWNRCMLTTKDNDDIRQTEGLFAPSDFPKPLFFIKHLDDFSPRWHAEISPK